MGQIGLVGDAIGWDVVNWSRALYFWKRTTSLDISSANILEIGGGTNGGISLWLASQGAHPVFSSIDGHAAGSRAVHKRYGQKHISYGRADVLHLDAWSGQNIIVFKSILGAVGRDGHADLQRLAIQQMYNALVDGGELWFAENVSGSYFHKYARKRFGAGKNNWRYPALDEIPDLFSPFEDLTFQTWGVVGAMGPTEPIRNVLGHADKVLSRLVGPQSRYLVYGLARKAVGPETLRCPPMAEHLVCDRNNLGSLNNLGFAWMGLASARAWALHRSR